MAYTQNTPEEIREMLGLLIIAAWMAALAAHSRLATTVTLEELP